MFIENAHLNRTSLSLKTYLVNADIEIEYRNLDPYFLARLDL